MSVSSGVKIVVPPVAIVFTAVAGYDVYIRRDAIRAVTVAGTVTIAKVEVPTSFIDYGQDKQEQVIGDAAILSEKIFGHYADMATKDYIPEDRVW